MENKTFKQILFENLDGHDWRNSFNKLESIVEKYTKYQIKIHLEKAYENARIEIKDDDGNIDLEKFDTLAFPGDSSPAKIKISKSSITEIPIGL